MNKRPVEIFVNGKAIKQYAHDGRIFVEAKIGSEYTIKIQNSSYKRKLVVATIHGLNVITGQPCSGKPTESGYIVNGYDSLEIKGFRKDSDSVGAFKFCPSNLSYCNEKGLGGNNGVIGVRIYDERIMLSCPVYTNPEPIFPWKYETPVVTYQTIEVNDRSTSAFSCSQQNTASMSFSAGTTWGSEIKDSVIEAGFDASGHYEDYIIFYDTRDNLKKLGIDLEREKKIHYPKAFGAFATPPSGWRG